jgi:hypothetical protein
MTLHKDSNLSRPCPMWMDRMDSMELVHKPMQDILALGPELETRFPSSPVANSSDPKMNCVL